MISAKSEGAIWAGSVAGTVGAGVLRTQRQITSASMLDAGTGKGRLTPGQYFAWQWTREGERIGDIRVRTETDRVFLIYRHRNGGEWQDKNYPVYLDWTALQLWRTAGRGFSVLPQAVARRVAVLYGGGVFACRHCHHLAYPSQNESVYERAARRSRKIVQTARRRSVRRVLSRTSLSTCTGAPMIGCYQRRTTMTSCRTQESCSCSHRGPSDTVCALRPCPSRQLLFIAEFRHLDRQDWLQLFEYLTA